MKNLSLPLIISLLFLGFFSHASENFEFKKIEKKTVWTFTNSTGEDANDLHMELNAGCLPTNIIVDEAGIRRAGGVFTDFPNQGSPSHHDYDGGTVANGESITLQFDTETKPKKWWWTKDGERIGDIEYADSDDLVSVTPQSPFPDYLDYSAKGTGQTTGHVITLDIHNPTAKPVTVTIPVCYVPSDGEHQGYVIIFEITVTVGINQTVSVPLKGYCADIYKPAHPLNKPVTNVENWEVEDPDYLATISHDDVTGNRPLSENANFTATIPGTNISITKNIDQFEDPKLFAQLSIAAFKKVKEKVTEMTDELIIDPESTIQQTGWIYTAALTGDFYKVEHLLENGKKQFETQTGKKFEKASPEEQKDFENSVNVIYTSFKFTGVEAKVFKISNHVEADSNNKIDYDDLPLIIKKAYQIYKLARDMNKSHRDALRDAFSNEEMRKLWGDTFKKIYGK